MSGVRAVLGYCNLAQRTDWAARKKTLFKKLDEVYRASLYSFPECDYDMAEEISRHLGWGAEGRPSWRTDENRNSVLWDPAKWQDLDTQQFSLAATSGDLADRHFRSVNWVLMKSRQHGEKVWIGASHLSNSAPLDRPKQAGVLVSKIPKGNIPKILGIDRNAFDASEPSKIIAAALPLLSDGMKDSFIGDGVQAGRPPIDGIHGIGVEEILLTQIDMRGASDHSGYRIVFRVPPADLT